MWVPGIGYSIPRVSVIFVKVVYFFFTWGLQQFIICTYNYSLGLGHRKVIVNNNQHDD